MTRFSRLCAGLLVVLPLGGCVTGPGDGSWADKANLFQMANEVAGKPPPRTVPTRKASMGKPPAL